MCTDYLHTSMVYNERTMVTSPARLKTRKHAYMSEHQNITFLILSYVIHGECDFINSWTFYWSNTNYIGQQFQMCFNNEKS